MINVTEIKLVKIVDMKLKKSDKQFLLDVKLDTGGSYVYVRDIEIAHMYNILKSIKIEQDNLTDDCMISGLFKIQLLSRHLSITNYTTNVATVPHIPLLTLIT